MRLKTIALALLLASSSARAQAPEVLPSQLAPQAGEENPLTLARVKDSVDGFALSPDGKSVVLWGVDWGDPNLPGHVRHGKVQVWDVATHTMKANMAGHTDAVQHAIWSRDGSQIASQSQDGMVALWDAASGKLKSTLAPSGGELKFGRDATPEEMGRSMKAAAERPRLLGFALDGSQVLALAGKVELPKAPAKDKDGKPKALSFFDYVQPVLLAWDTASGRLQRTVPFGKAGGRGGYAALLPDGKRFITAVEAPRSADFINTGVETRDLQSGALLSTWTLPKPFTYLTELSADGKLALGTRWEGKTFDRTRVQVFEAASGKPLQVLEDAQANLSGARFSRDGLKLIAPVPGGPLAIFDIASGKRDKVLSTDFTNDISQADITPGGKYLLAAQQAGRDLLRWDLSVPPSNPFAPRPLAQASNVRAIRFAPDGSLWVGWGDADWGQDLRTGKALQLRHIAPDGKVLEQIEIADKRLIDQVTFSPDFSLAAAQLGTQPQPAYMEGAGVGVWDIASKKLLWHLPGDRYLMDSLAFAPGNKALLSASNEGTVQEWDLATGKLLRPLFRAQSSVESLLYSPDGKRLAIGTEGGSIIVLARPSGEKIAELGNDASARGLAWSPDGKRIAAGGTVSVGGTVVGVSLSVWEVESQRVVAEFAVPERLFGGLALSPDGKRLAVAHFQGYERRDDGQVSVWDIESKRLLVTLRDKSGAEHPAFSPDGKTLATTNGQWLKAWDLPNDLAAAPANP